MKRLLEESRKQAIQNVNSQLARFKEIDQIGKLSILFECIFFSYGNMWFKDRTKTFRLKQIKVIRKQTVKRSISKFWTWRSKSRSFCRYLFK